MEEKYKKEKEIRRSENSMKKGLLVLLSILLVAASIFGLFAGVKGVKEVMNVMEYKQDQANAGYYAILHNDERITDRDTYPKMDQEASQEPGYNNSMIGGIDLLRENITAYVEGVPEYEAGLVQLEEGKLALAEGQLKLNQGYADYAAGQQQLAEGKQTLDDGEAQYAAALQQYNEGVAMIQANTERYNEGKAQLAQIEPLMPYVNAYVNFRNGVVDSLPGWGQQVFYNAQAWFASIVVPLAANLGISLGSNVTDFPAAVQQMVADGKAQLKEYEDGLAMLEAAKPQLEAARAQLDAGHVTYNEGVAALNDGAAQLAAGEQAKAEGMVQLADGEKQLADGKSQLDLFESSEDALIAGALMLINQPAYRTGDVGAIQFTTSESDGKAVCRSVAEMLTDEEYIGDSFDINNPEDSLWQKDENGNFIVLNDHKLIDLDACEKVAKAGQDYIEKEQGAAVEGELIGRIITYALLALASVFGIIAGLFGLLSAGSISKGKIGAATTFGWLTTILAVAGLVWGIIKGAFGGYAFFPLTDPVPYKAGTEAEAVKYATGTYHLAPMIALVCLAVLGVLFVLIAGAAKKAYKRSKATVTTAAYTAAAPVAVPVAEPVTVEAPVVKTVVEEPVVHVAEPVVAAPVVEVVSPVESAAAAQAAAAAAMAAATPVVVVKTAADWAKEAQEAADEAQALAAAGDYEAAKAAARRAAAAAEEAVKAANAQV